MLILLVTQIAVIATLFLESATLVGTKLGESLSSLLGVIDIVYRQADPATIEQISEFLSKNTSVQLVSGTVVNEIVEPPPYPVLLILAKNVQKFWGGKVVISYQSEPLPMLWFQKNTPPCFALGIPFMANSYWVRLIQSTLFIILVAAIFIAWLIVRRINQPLLKLAQDALEMGRDPHMKCITPHPSSFSEVIVLSDALNAMRADIDRMVKERETFLAGISHDLRTPLSRLRIAVEMLDADSSKYVEGMAEDIDEMSAILRQTIELAHLNIESDGLWVEGDINQLLQDIQGKYQRAGILLALELADMPKLRYKTQALTRLLYNLIDNGFKYGGGQVRLISRMDFDIPVIAVVNTGTAMSMNNISDSVKPQGVDSNGLGLVIVQRIADLHGATLKISERASNGGWEVTLGFPAHP